jgi:molybdopterin synthase catalytic subunit
VRAVATVEDGAICTFVGTARRHSEGKEVNLLRYDAYPEMAEKVIEEILGDAARRFPDVKVSAMHRLGPCPLGEASVAVVAAAPHRDTAFAACRFVIDAIKKSAPIWKQEVFGDGTEWVGDPTSFRSRPAGG